MSWKRWSVAPWVIQMCLPITLASALGAEGDPPSCIKGDEAVVFFPTIGHRNQGGGTWDLAIHGWIHEPRSGGSALAAFSAALGMELLAPTSAKAKIFAERARAFVADNERGKQVRIRLGGKTYALGESGPNGHFHGRLQLTAAEVEALRRTSANRRCANFQAVMRPEDSRVFNGRVHLIEAAGISVVSDIDDTVKITEVRDRKALLANTFLRPFRSVPGMAEVFASWAKTRGVTFHYVSASPWQLYVPLRGFLWDAGFPAGTFHFKLFRWKDRSFFNLFDSPETYKLAAVEPILRQFPKRRFVLVGDSGEEDPEAYGELARRHPGQVARILIRDVTGESHDAHRYQTAFKGLPQSLWRVFREAREIQAGLPGATRPTSTTGEADRETAGARGRPRL